MCLQGAWGEPSKFFGSRLEKLQGRSTLGVMPADDGLKVRQDSICGV